MQCTARYHAVKKCMSYMRVANELCCMHALFQLIKPSFTFCVVNLLSTSSYLYKKFKTNNCYGFIKLIFMSMMKVIRLLCGRTIEVCVCQQCYKLTLQTFANQISFLLAIVQLKYSPLCKNFRQNLHYGEQKLNLHSWVKKRKNLNQ